MARFPHFSLRRPTLGHFMACLSILGFAVLCYFLGAAAMYYELPSSSFLDHAFAGAQAWHERGRSEQFHGAGTVKSEQGVTVDKPDKTYDGFTLLTTTEAGSRAKLINMRGEAVHEWGLPFSKAWVQASQVHKPLPDAQVHWFRAHLFPNGDLLAVYHAEGDTPYGYGLVKVDKDSKLLWAYGNNVHHDVDVDEDGKIYTLTHQILTTQPAGLEKFVPVPLLADSLVVLSPEGRELESIPILEALRDSPFILTLSSVTKRSSLLELDQSTDPGLAQNQPAADESKTKRAKEARAKGDLTHANSVKVLRRDVASKFPLFKPGQVLISLRNLDTIVVVDRPSRSVTWAAGGIWRIQHDAEFLENGRLLLYDNFGSFTTGTRILEYDPQTQGIPWSYTNENTTRFSAFFRGMKQRLPNGNTLIVDPENSRLFEVTPEKELVWESFCSPLPAPQVKPTKTGRAITGAQRYGPDELTFLKGVARVRP
jgi:Arylsulfotransferase (ASST)